METKSNHEQYLAFINLWQSSGESQKAFCKSRFIPYHTFSYYLRKFRKNRSEASKTHGFISLEVGGLEGLEKGPSLLEIIYPNGCRIQFRESVPASFVRALVSS